MSLSNFQVLHRPASKKWLLEDSRRKKKRFTRLRIEKMMLTGWKNCLKCSKGKSESEVHRYFKWLVADFCWENNIDFYTEATFGNKIRADLYIPKWNLIIEILHSEKYKDFKKKVFPKNVLAVPTSIKPIEFVKALLDMMTIKGQGFEYYNKRFNE